MLFAYSYVDVHLAYFYVLSFVNNTAMSIGVQVSL